MQFYSQIHFSILLLQTPSFKVSECNWILSPEQELQIIKNGVSESPVTAVFQDAAQLHALASQVSIHPVTSVVVVSPPPTQSSSTVQHLTNTLRSSLNSAIVSFESIALAACEAILYDPRFLSFIQFKGKMDITFADTQLLSSAAQILYDHVITVATGGNQSLLYGTLKTVKQAAKNLQCLLPPPPIPIVNVIPTNAIPTSAPMVDAPLSLGSLGSLGSMGRLLESLPPVVSAFCTLPPCMLCVYLTNPRLPICRMGPPRPRRWHLRRA